MVQEKNRFNVFLSVFMGTKKITAIMFICSPLNLLQL